MKFQVNLVLEDGTLTDIQIVNTKVSILRYRFAEFFEAHPKGSITVYKYEEE